MGARAALVIAAVAVLTLPVDSYKADATILLQTSSKPAQNLEKHYSPELKQQLHQVKSDALLLYTEYCSKAAADLKCFNSNVTRQAEHTLQRVYTTVASSPERCRYEFQNRLRKIETDAHKAATFSTETHHKFLLGHMIVFRMHLNKSEEFIKRSERTTNARVMRWRRLAICEIHRVRDDVEHARKAYADLLIHASRKLNHLRKNVNTKLEVAVTTLLQCAREPYEDDVSNERK